MAFFKKLDHDFSWFDMTTKFSHPYVVFSPGKRQTSLTHILPFSCDGNVRRTKEMKPEYLMLLGFKNRKIGGIESYF